jgi:hypothetical protein
MSQTTRSRLVAALGFVVACLVGLLTNILTSSFSWAALAALAALVVVGAAIAAWQHSGRQGTTGVSQTVGRGGVIRRSPIKLTGRANVDDRVSGRSGIVGSAVTAKRGLVRRRVRAGGNIVDSDVTIE